MIQCRTIKTDEEFSAYYLLRWQILRAPWSQPKGSEKDELESQSIHRGAFDENNTLVGISRLHFTSQHNAQVRYVAVSSEYSGKGIGRLLMIDIEQQAMKRGATRIDLNARENALSFYRKIGYLGDEFSHQLFGEINHFAMHKFISNIQTDNGAIGTPQTLKQNAASQLQKIWHETIPLSKAMNMEIPFYDGKQLLTCCDTNFNKNLHNTMFAGSIYTLATLTGWGWVYLAMEQENLRSDIVLADAQIRYHKPVKGPANGQVLLEHVNADFSTYDSRGKVRFNIEVSVLCGDEVVATFKGLYFAVAKN